MTDASDPIEARIEDALRNIDASDLDVGPPPAGLWDSIVAALEPHEGADDPDRSRVAPPASSAAASPAVGTTWTRRRILTLVAAAAAVIAMAIALPSVIRSDESSDITARATLSDEGLAARTPFTGSAELVRDGDETLLELDVPDLPATTSGSVYEVWLLTPDGSRLQSLGLTDGRGRFLIPAGVDPDQYDVVDVSREPTDGNPAHSGDSLVRGRLRPA